MNSNPFHFNLEPLGGLKVYEEPLPPPKITLGEHIQLTDEFRREMNAWLLARFGRRKPVLDRDSFLVSEKYGVVITAHGMAGILRNIAA